MKKLLSKSLDFADDVYRNIVSLKKSEDLFDDICEDDISASHVALSAEMRIKKEYPSGLLGRSFHYSTSIGYPFSTEPYMTTRYGDGSYPVWYGSFDIATTIHETAYHMMRNESNIEGLDEIIVRERAVYQIHCQSLLIDISNKYNQYPQLIIDDYHYTQQIGKRLQSEGHPGLIAPSARYKGKNIIIFNQQVLSNPRVHHYLTYRYHPSQKTVTVERNLKDKECISFSL